jgi:hypothetical protein
MRIRICAAVALAAAGCSAQYIYRPTANATASSNGYPAAHYQVPPESPHGDVDIASYGITEMQVGDDDHRDRFLQVRMVVANNNDVGAWQVDTREQIVVLPNEGQSRPAFANGDAPTLPVVTIAPGQKHSVDLFYALPEGMRKAKHVPHFDVLWHVKTPSRDVAERTPFERTSADEQMASAYPWGPPEFSLAVGWGPVWWYDPLIAPVTFAHPVVIHERYPVFVRAPHYPPRRVYAPMPHRAYVVPPHVGFHAARPMGRRF